MHHPFQHLEYCVVPGIAKHCDPRLPGSGYSGQLQLQWFASFFFDYLFQFR